MTRPHRDAWRDMPEKEWQTQVLELARTLGWTWYHTYRSRRSPSGYPDLTLVRERILWAELKTEKGKPTPAQHEWLDKLEQAGGEVYVWRPSDFDLVGRVLQTRGPMRGAA